MKLKKPIEEFSLNELYESKALLQSVINSTNIIIDTLGEEPSTLSEHIDAELILTFLPERMPMNFRELVDKQLNEFMRMYELVLEEILKREMHVVG